MRRHALLLRLAQQAGSSQVLQHLLSYLFFPLHGVHPVQLHLQLLQLCLPLHNLFLHATLKGDMGLAQAVCSDGLRSSASSCQSAAKA